MAKSTKTVKPIQSLQRFNRSSYIEHVTLKGATTLADVELVKGELILTLSKDKTKANLDDFTTLQETVERQNQLIEQLTTRITQLETTKQGE